MFRIEEYIDELIGILKDAFGKRLVYIGLQGSYLRKEETKDSDIDIMAVIDNLSVEDLKTYQKALVEIGNFNKSCGFICSKADLEHWNPLEPIGNLSFIEYDKRLLRRIEKPCSCVYHGRGKKLCKNKLE